MASKKYVESFYFYNVKTIEQFEAVVNGRPFIIAGPNEHGKTTAFQGLERLLNQLPEGEKPAVWLRKGAEEGMMKVVVVDNGDRYEMEEKFNTRTRSRIRLYRKLDDEGGREEQTPAQDRISQILGNGSNLTPLMNLSGKKQFDFIKNAIGLDVSGFESKRKERVKKRTGIKRELDMKKTLLKNYTDITEEVIAAHQEEKRPEDLLAKKTLMKPLRDKHEQVKQKIDERSEMAREISELEIKLWQLAQELERKQKEYDGLPDYVDELREVVQEIATAEINNKQIDEEIKTVVEYNEVKRRVCEQHNYKARVGELEDEFTAMSNVIKSEDKNFIDKINGTEFEEAVPGLKLMYQMKTTEEEEEAGIEPVPEMIGLFLDDLPFNRTQFSTAKMIKSILKLGVLLNPDGLNFCYIQEWGLMDKKNQKEILDFAAEHPNVQLGIEKVDDTKTLEVQFIDLK